MASPRLWSCFVVVASHIAERGRSTWRSRRFHLVLIAVDRLAARSLANGWYSEARQSPTWPILFGTGPRNAVAVTLEDIEVHEVPGGIVVVS